MSFDIFVVMYRVTNFLPKLLHMLLFSMEKTEFPGFPLFSGYAIFVHFRFGSPFDVQHSLAVVLVLVASK